MHVPKLFTILSHLEKEEWNSWIKGVKGQIIPGNDAEILLDVLISSRSKLDSLGQADDLQLKYFPTRSVKYVSNMLSTFLNWTEDWIVLQQIKAEKFQKELTLVRWYNERGLYTFANTTAVDLESQLGDAKNLSLLSKRAKMSLLHAQYFSNNNVKNELGPSMLEELAHNFIEVTQMQALMYASELVNWGRIKSHDFSKEITLMEQLLLNDPQPQGKQYLYDLFELMRKPNLDLAVNLKKRLFEGELNSGEEIHTIATLYIGAILVKLHSIGIPIPQNYFMQITEYGMQHGVYTQHGRLTNVSFHNLIMAISINADFDEVKAFIEKWAQHVQTKNKEATAALAMAQNCFYHERYREMVRYTWRSDFEFHNQKTMAMCLHCIACFMFRNEDPDIYLNALTSFKKSLLRSKDKFTIRNYKNYSNLLDFMKRCDNESPEQISLDQYDSIIYRKWCVKVLATLKKK